MDFVSVIDPSQIFNLIQHGYQVIYIKWENEFMLIHVINTDYLVMQRLKKANPEWSQVEVVQNIHGLLTNIHSLDEIKQKLKEAFNEEIRIIKIKKDE